MILFCVIIFAVNNGRKKTLSKLLTKPALNNIKFDEVDKLLVALGCERKEGSGSRVGFFMNDKDLTLHKPHPNNELLEYAVKHVQRFLNEIGVIK
jgi:hypothetical protein